MVFGIFLPAAHYLIKAAYKPARASGASPPEDVLARPDDRSGNGESRLAAVWAITPHTLKPCVSSETSPRRLIVLHAAQSATGVPTGTLRPKVTSIPQCI
jgi:hypothetical protein